MGRSTITLRENRKEMRSHPLSVVLMAIAVSACASLKTPTLSVEKIEKPKLGISGARLQVVFSVRNPNPDDLLLEKMEFDLELSGRRVGRGYVSETVRLPGFGRERVRSEVDVNLLSLPGAVREALEEDRARARVEGDFYVRTDGGRLKRLSFSSSAETRLDRDRN
jgi:LEA14-like dessication related protein